MTIGDRIQQARKARKLTQNQLGKLVGGSRPAVGRWEANIDVPRPPKVSLIADALGVSSIWLQAGGGKAMPVKGEVAAGIWHEAVEELEIEPIPVLPSPDFPAEAQYGLLVRGTSMNKIAADSDYLHVVDVISTGIVPRPGDIVIALRRRHGVTETTAKRLAAEGSQLVLKSESTDPRYQEPLSIGAVDDDTEVVISAIVLGRYSAFGRPPS